MPRHDGLSLTFCQSERRLLSGCATLTTVAFDDALVDIRGILFKPDPSGSENASTSFASRREDDTNPNLA
jgi:hypothetical protein